MLRFFLILPALIFLLWQGLKPTGGSLEFEWLPSWLFFGNYWTDVLLNLGGFYLFTLLVLPSFPQRPGRTILFLYLLVAFFEIVQYLCLPFRWATFHDVIYGWTGIALAALTLHISAHFPIGGASPALHHIE